MMKKILLLAGIVSLAACTNDPEETFSQGGGSSAGVKVIYDAEGAVEGQLIVKFRPSAADSLAAALASASATRAGFATADELLEQLAQLQAKREEIRKVRKCPNCGASCATDAHFCSRCGMVLHEETSVVVPEEVQQSEVPEQEAPSEPEKQDEEPLIEEKL